MSRHDFNPDWLNTKQDYEMIIRETIAEHQEVIEELISLNLWQARRLKHTHHKNFAYDHLDKITGRENERL